MSAIGKKVITAILLSSILVFGFTACTTHKQTNVTVGGDSIKIQYLGHAAFVVSDQKNTKLGIDFWTPKACDYAVDTPSKLGITEKDNLTRLLITHDHDDHDYVPFKVKEIRGIEEYNVRENPKVEKIGETIIGRYKAYHSDGTLGYDTSDDVVFVITMNNIKVVHVGDAMGTMNNKAALEKLKKKIGDIDILMMPVGESDINAISKISLENTVKIMNPKIVIPMHYFKTEHKKQFISDMQNEDYKTEDINENYKTITKSDLQSIDKTVIWNMKPGEYTK